MAVIGLAQWAGSRLDNSFALASSPSQQAQNLLASRLPSQKGDSADVVLRSPGPLDSPGNAAAIGRLVKSLQPLAHVSGVQSPRGLAAVRSCRLTSGSALWWSSSTPQLLSASAVWRVIDTARSIARPGLRVAVGGPPVEQVVSAAPGTSEMIGLLAAVVVMLLAFGSVVAMSLPILTALVGVGIGSGILAALSHLVAVPTFGPDMMIMIGLGVGIDYALFVVTRYRQGLAERQPPRDATIVTLSTAGRAVLFAGATVVIALLGLFVVGLPFMDGLAAATVIAVVLVLVAALTVLPAIFGFAGMAIDRLHIPGLLARPAATTSRGFWSRWSETVQRRPWICAVSALAVLTVLAVPLFSMRLAFGDPGNDPSSLTTRQAYDLLADGFGPGFNGPLVVAADLRGPHAQASIGLLGSRLRHMPGVASASPPVINAARDAAVMVVYPTTAPQSAQTAALVHRLRSQVIPRLAAGTGVTAFVGGETAAGADTSAYLAARLPWVIATVVLLAFLLLVVVFRSIAIPVKAAAMNLLSIGAAARVITAAAAAIMICVFGSFVIGDPLRILAVFGLGLAAAVLVDATVVRMVLVPAVMQLRGSANWWLPRWLGRAIPNITIEPDLVHCAGTGLTRPQPVSEKAAE